jgi:hypothetical protein
MIDHVRILREPDRLSPFDAVGSPDAVEELHFNVRVHRRWYRRGPFEASNPRDRIYFEPVPCQPCTWEEILRACALLVELRSRAQERRDREDRARMEREDALRMLGRFLRWVGVTWRRGAA